MVTTGDKLQALQKDEARLYLFARGEYQSEDGATYPLPFCRKWDKDISDNLILCPDNVRLLARADDNSTPTNAPSVSPTNVSPTPLSVADRPYVVVESAMLTILAPNEKTSPIITIVNKGRTPAQRISLSLQIAAKPGFGYWLGFGDDDHRRPVNIGFLAAGDHVSVQGAPADEMTLDPKFFSDAMQGKESLMIHGMGNYEDMAGGEYPLEYAFGYDPGSKTFVADFGGPNRKEKWMDEKKKKQKPQTNPN